MTADGIIKVASAFATWMASHVVAAGAVVTAILPMLVILKVAHFTTEELAGLQLGVAAVVAAITGTGTVSKPRVGERIDEGVEKKMVERVREIRAGNIPPETADMEDQP